MQNFGEHGRELVTVEVALELLRQLGDPVGAVERSVARGQGPHRLLALLRHSVFMVSLYACMTASQSLVTAAGVCTVEINKILLLFCLCREAAQIKDDPLHIWRSHKS